MNTKLIEYIITIAEEKSLSKAAERLYISQPALSQRLKKLEEELQTPLFVRDKDGLSITDAGRIYINGGRSILKIKEDAYQKLFSMNFNTTDTIRFGCATVRGLESINIFRGKFPNIELLTKSCTTPVARTALETGQMDLALLLTSTLEDETLEFLPLAKSSLYVGIPANHPVLRNPNPFSDGYQCLREDYFILSPAPSFTHEMELKALRLMGLKPRVLCETLDNVSKRYMLNKGMGIGFIPKYSVASSDSYRIFPISKEMEFYIAAAYRKDTPLTDPMNEMVRIWLTTFDERYT